MMMPRILCYMDQVVPTSISISYLEKAHPTEWYAHGKGCSRVLEGHTQTPAQIALDPDLLLT